MYKFSLILWKYHTKISSQFLRVNGILKFVNTKGMRRKNQDKI